MSGADDFDARRDAARLRINSLAGGKGGDGDVRRDWFDAVYRNAGDDAAAVPWADLHAKPVLTEWLSRHPGDGRTAIDVGCGRGDNGEALASAGYVATGFDVSERAVAWARQRFPQSSVHYAAADLFAPPPAWLGAFDLVNEVYIVQALDGAMRRAAPAAMAPVTLAGDRPEERVPMTRLRARIAERLIQSKNENAILTTFNEVNMGPVMALRKQYGEKFEKAHGVRLGFMGFFVKAAVAALKKFPILNASVDGNDIVYHGYIDIGIAVGSPRGLVVPILRNAESMSIADIEKKIAEFGDKAKNGKLTLEELSGGTFSISSLGGIGGTAFTPIVNAPEVAPEGVGVNRDFERFLVAVLRGFHPHLPERQFQAGEEQASGNDDERKADDPAAA